MQWYDPYFVVLFLIGLLMVFFMSQHHKKWMWGLLVMILAVLGRVVIWFGGTL